MREASEDDGPLSGSNPALALTTGDQAALLDDSPDIVAVLDRDGVIVHSNTAATSLLTAGRAAGVVEALELVHPDDVESLRTLFSRCVEMGDSGNAASPLGLRARIRVADRWRWYDVIARSRRSPSAGVVFTGRDITAQVDAEALLAESEQRFRSLITSSTDAVLMVSVDGAVLYASPAGEEMLGGATSIGDLAAMMHPDDLEVVRSTFRAAREAPVGSQHEVVLRIPGDSGEWRWIESWIVNQLGVPGVDSLVIYGRDITASRRTEATLRSRVEADILVAGIAARLVEVGAEEIERAIEDSLAELGRFCGADRAWIFRLHPDHRRIDYTHEWCAEGIERAIDDLEGVPIEAIPGFAGWVGSPQVLLIGSVAGMGPELESERRILEAQSVKSLAAQSMFVQGELEGVIGLDAVTSETRWPEQVVWALEACASILGSALRRCDAETELAFSESRYRAMFDQAADGVRVLDADLRATYISPAVLRMTGYQDADLVEPGRRLLLVHPNDRAVVEEARVQLLARPGQTVTGSFRMMRPDGGWVHIEEVSTNLLHDPAVRGIVVNVRDVTERHRHETELVEQARRDPVTGLPNRLLFEELLDAALARSELTGSPLAVLSLDLDRFKLVNDSLGHHAGDQVLVEASDRVRSVTRGGDAVARFGGDEFALLCEPAAVEEASILAERLIGAFREPVDVDGQLVYTTATIGIAVSRPGISRGAFLREADAAREEAKAAGGNRASVFAGQLVDTARERLELEAGLRDALEAGGLLLHYQPIVDLVDGSVVGAEALVRWQHPERGLLLPGSFLDVAEQTGLIGAIGEWVIDSGVEQLATWQQKWGSRAPVLHLNASVRQLADRRVANRLARAVAARSVDIAGLCIEVTESILLAGHGPLAELASLQRLGARVALDDFGTGQSSLAHLRTLAVDTVKIDRSFVDGIAEAGTDAAIVTAIIDLAHSLGLDVVAEGVEEPAQAEALVGVGCRHAQGFLYSRAVSAAEFEALVEDRALR